MKKKICFTATVSMTLQYFVLEVAKYLYETGKYDITFICNYDKDFITLLPEYIHYIPVKMKRGISFSAPIVMYKLLRVYKREKFDLVQYSTPNASFYASFASKMAKVPVRLYAQWGIAYVSFGGIKRMFFRMIEKTICSLSSVIEPDSFGNQSFSISQRLYNTEKSCVVWNGSASGVNLSRFNRTKKDLLREEGRKIWKINSDATVIGFVGRITRDKGINELLEAVRKVISQNENVILLLVGKKENQGLIDNKLIGWAENSSQVIFTGEQLYIEMFYSMFDILVLPSYREGFGTVVIEAGALEVPVIATDIPGPNEVIQNNINGLLVPSKDSRLLFEAILKLCEDDNLRMELAKNAYHNVVNKYDSSILFKKIEENKSALLRN